MSEMCFLLTCEESKPWTETTVFSVSAVLITNYQCLLRVHSLQLNTVCQHCQYAHKPPVYPPPTHLCNISEPGFPKVDVLMNHLTFSGVSK